MSATTLHCCLTGRTLVRCEGCGKTLDMAEVVAVGEHGGLCASCLPIAKAECERAMAARAGAEVGAR